MYLDTGGTIMDNNIDNKNEENSGYTGEYGNSVEGAGKPGDGTYSYSYRDGNNSVTHSGDYYASENTSANAQQNTDYYGAQNYSNNSQNNNQSYQQYYNNQGSQPQYDNSGNFYNGNNTSNHKKKEKKPMGTGKKLLVCAACAVVFGVVAGVCFEGVRYVTNDVLGISSTQATKQIGTTTDNNSKESSDKVTTKSSGNVNATVGTTDVSAIVEQTMPAIVAITSTSEGTDYYDLFGQYYQGEDTASSGSGFIVGQNKKELLIATNNHVIDGAKTISVKFIDDEVYEATVKGTDSGNDLAVIAVKLKSLKNTTADKIKIADLGNSDDLKVGEMAIAIGNALGYGQSVTVGYISAKDREITESSKSGKGGNKIKAIQTDAAINPGNSGGALLNLKGQVIGINSAKIASSSVEGVGYAIPITVATPIIDDLMNKEVLTDAQKGYLGISGRTVSDEASVYNIPSGVYIAEIADGGAADKAGLKVGDIVTAVNSMEVTTIESLQEKVNSYKKGTKVELTILRSNDGSYKEQKITVTLQGSSSLNGLSSDSKSGNNSQNGNSGNGNSGNNGSDNNGSDNGNYGSDEYGSDDGESGEDGGFGGFLNPFGN